MNNALLYFGALLALVLAALFAVPHFIDWNGYRGIFEEEATKVLGREVRVGGAVNVRLLPTPFVSFEKVRLADPTGQTGEPFVRAESFTMRLSGPALLRGVLEANKVELDKPVLTLALDDNGSGNWSSIQIRSAALPFVPKDVALRSVKINDGAITVYNARGKPIARLGDINGTFSADSIRGPFNFKGSIRWSGSEREVRIATTEPDAAGTFQLKASIHDLASPASYLLDANVTDLSAKLHLQGQLTGSLPLMAIASARKEKKTEGDRSEAPLMDLQAHVDANTSGAKITDLALSLESAAEPQLISGSASATWGATSEFSIDLDSKWIDFDRLAGAGQGAATFSKVKSLSLSVLRSLAGSGKAVAKLDIDQVKLGGETTGAMRVDAERRGSAVHVRELRAGLPGGARLELSGDLKDTAGKVSFAGSGYIHGTNLARLLEWTRKSGARLDIKADGPFSAEGRVLIADNRFELTEASADIGGRPFTGDISVGGDERRKVSVTLEAARIDTSKLFPETAAALDANLRHALGIDTGARKDAGVEADSRPATDSDESDISVRILAGELKHRDATYHDVDVTVRFDGREIRIPAARFATENGLVARIDARIATEEATPKGTLAFDFDARTPAAVRDLAGLADISSIVPPEKVAHTNSAKAAGLLRLGLRSPTSADVSVDGTIEGARVQSTAEFDGGLRGWRTEPSRLRMTARGPALGSILAAFGADTQRLVEASSHEAELVVASTGRLQNGATAIADLTAPGFDVSMRGTVAMAKDSTMTIAASANVKAADMLDALAIAGLSAGEGIGTIPLEGTFEVTRDRGSWTLASGKVKAGNTTLKGQATFTSQPGEAEELSAVVEADSVELVSLVSALTERTTSQKMKDQEDAKRSIWPDAIFSIASLKPAVGTINLSFKNLRIDAGIALHDGAVKISLSPKLVAADLTGTAADGAVTGKVAFSKAPSGTAFDSTLHISSVKLAKLGANGAGEASLDMRATAQAQSPAGLIAVMAGEGTLKLNDAALRTPSPAIGPALVKSIIDDKVANNADAIAAEVEKAAHASTARIGSQTLAIKISDGVAKIDPFTIGSDGTSVTATTTVDLMSMAVDSAWKLVTIVPPLPALSQPLPSYKVRQPKGPLPPISIVYTGNLSDLAAIDMDVDADDMQRELAVQLMERNVDQLERIRLQDRRRAETERARRKAAEDARLAAEKVAAEKAATEKSGSSSGPESGDPPGTSTPDPAASAPPAPQTSIPKDQSVVPGQESDANVQVEPRPRPRPRRVQARRSTQEDIMRSLGGYP